MPLWFNYVLSLIVLLLLYVSDSVLFSNALPDLIATFLGIFIGLTASGQRANTIRRYEENEQNKLKREAIKKIFVAIVDELQSNRGRILYLLENGFTNSLPAYLQTTTWEVYENRLGDADTLYVKGLTRIYYKLTLLNHVIRQETHLIPLGKGPHREEYKLIASNALEEIDIWIALMQKYPSKG